MLLLRLSSTRLTTGRSGHEGNILIPVVIAFFAVSAFLLAMNYAIVPPANQNSDITTKNINTACSGVPEPCPDGTLVWRTEPKCEYSTCPIEVTNTNIVTNQTVITNQAVANTNKNSGSNTNVTNAQAVTARTDSNVNAVVVTDATAGWGTYTNEKYGFSFKYPPDWTLTENKVTIGQNQFDGVQVAAKDNSDSFAVTAIPFYRGQTDPVEEFEHYSGIIIPTSAETPITIADIYGSLVTAANMTPTTAAFIDHEDVAFKLDQDSNQANWANIVRSFAFTDGNIDLEKTNPIKKITDIAPTLNITGTSTLSIMGDNAMVGRFFGTTTNGQLLMYDGNKSTDITENVAAADPEDANKTYGVNSIANNGQYWLVSVCRHMGGNYLYKYDGTNWTNLTSYVRAAQKKQGCFGPGMYWNGTDWLFTYNLQLIKYDGGTTFTDVPLSPEFAQQFIIFGAIWNGSYYLIPTNGSVWKTFKYDGQTFTKLPLPDDNHVAAAGWNGSYWLLSGLSNQPILKYDGQTITTTNFPSYQQMSANWLKSIWIVGPYFYDGTTLDKTTPFRVSYRVDKIVIGDKYGLMAGGGRIWRFDY